MPKVSVIIPTYNREHFIERSLNSVFNQTFQDFEVIVVDDGSTDNTKKVLKPYNGRIKYFYQENGGCSAARNRGIEESQGQYIGFLDSDDLWLPEKLAIQVDILDKHKNVGIVCTKMIMFNEKGERIGIKPEEPTGRNFMELIEIQGDIPNSSVLTRRECFDKAGLFDPQLRNVQDFDMWLRIAEHYDIYEYKEKSLAHYFCHSNQNVSSRKNMLIGLTILNKKILRNYKHLPEFPHFVYRKKISSHEYWLSKAYYDEQLYWKALKSLLAVLLRFPLVGVFFIKKNDGIFKKMFIIVKPFLFVVVCSLKCCLQGLQCLTKKAGRN